MKIYMDCAYGLGGDMFLAGLCGLGLDVGPLERAFHEVGIAVSITVHDEKRQGVAGKRISVDWPAGQPLRHLPELADIVNRLAISDHVRERSLNALNRLAEAEACVHGVAVESIHFHEVGAVDTLVDVVGAFWGLEAMGVTGVSASKIPWFTGTVNCEHGCMPLPAPATARLLEGKPVYPTDFTQEMITPTGALLIDQLAGQFADGPDGRLVKGATAYGTRDSGGGLRVFLLESGDERVEQIYQLEANIDHLTGEELGHCYEALLEAGALDVLFTHGVMKKNRPAGTLTVLCQPEMLEAVQSAYFKHTHTLGLRRMRVERVTLVRHTADEPTRFGTMPVKHYEVEGTKAARTEYEALAEFARKTGRSLPELRFMLGVEEGEK